MDDAKQLAETVLAVLDAQKTWSTETSLEDANQMLGEIHHICAKVFFLALRVAKQEMDYE